MAKKKKNEKKESKKDPNMKKEEEEEEMRLLNIQLSNTFLTYRVLSNHNFLIF